MLDFGNGRKLERFGGLILDRPSPAAENASPLTPELWKSADFAFEAGWQPASKTDDWRFRWEETVLELRLSPFGHVGLFPEQISNWRWLQQAVRHANCQVTALNLFGYTGGSSLAMASAGAKVAHVDASQPTVRWAKRNAELSGLQDKPIRWIVDDARDFVQRELRRGSKYDIITMDPPAYGHGSDGKDWKIEVDLDPLIKDCLKLLSEHPIAFLLTGHSPIPSLDAGPISQTSWKLLTKAFAEVTKHRVGLLDSHRRKLDFGYAYRFRR